MYKSVILSIFLVLFSGLCLAIDPKYSPPPPTYKSNFQRSIEQAPKAPKYTPPNPHKGRLQIPKTDYSIGGKIDPPSVNIKTTTK